MKLEIAKMRSPSKILILLAAMLVVPGAQVFAKAAVGEPAPTFTGTGSNGAQHSLGQYRGQFVVLEWTNDGCPYVGKHYGTKNMQGLQKEHVAKGVVWLSIISSAPGKQGYAGGDRANGLTVDRGAAPSAVLLDPDGAIGRLYGAKTTPHMFVVDPEGTLVYMGAIDNIPSANWDDVGRAENYVRIALEQSMAGQPVSNAVTRPYGCSVKYGS